MRVLLCLALCGCGQMGLLGPPDQGGQPDLLQSSADATAADLIPTPTGDMTEACQPGTFNGAPCGCSGLQCCASGGCGASSPNHPAAVLVCSDGNPNICLPCGFIGEACCKKDSTHGWCQHSGVCIGARGYGDPGGKCLACGKEQEQCCDLLTCEPGLKCTQQGTQSICLKP